MNATVGKQVHIAESRARRLKESAAEHGATEDPLIEEGLDLLFLKQANQLQREADDEEDRQLLARLVAESGPVPYNTRRWCLATIQHSLKRFSSETSLAVH